MSGSAALAAVQALGQLFGGYGTVTLGPMVLEGLELPKAIPIGGKQQLDVHTLPGGARAINVMGPNLDEISWSGVFVGQGASERVRFMNSIMTSGQPIVVAWDVYSYTCIVAMFTCQTRITGTQPYKISLLVQQDNTSPTGTTLADLASQVTADLASGNPLGALSAVSQGVVAGPVAAATTAAGMPGATTVGSALYQSAVGAVNTAAGAINGAVASVGATLGPVATGLGAVASVAGVGLDTTAMGANISAAAQNCGDLANLTQASGFYGRVSANLANASA